MKSINLALKRVFDIIVSFLGLLILLLPFALISLLIVCTSKGPAFFVQERLGKKGNVFKIYKFRTMVVNAEHMGTGLVIETEKDNRITSIGRFLRATSLDELPQLINVLNGTMSFIGPRPPVTYHPYPGYDAYPDWAKKRFEMRPGITGLAQICVRNSVPWDERMKYDVQYIESFNIWQDIRIFFLTIVRVLKRTDIYKDPNVDYMAPLPEDTESTGDGNLTSEPCEAEGKEDDARSGEADRAGVPEGTAGGSIDNAKGE